MGNVDQYKFLILSLSLIFFSLWSTRCYSQSQYPSMRFLGAAQMIGGSCYLIDTGKTRVLIDFGLFYGEDEERNRNIDFDPATINFVLLTHAHADHAGRVPLLYRKGFKGKTIGTDATKDLSGITLKVKPGLAGKKEGAPYDFNDFSRMMENFVVAPYGRMLDLNSEISIRFRHAGHIMGSSMIEMWIKEQGRVIKIVATGDLGNSNLPLLKKADIIRDGDYILVESTSGAVRRKDAGFEGFGHEIQKTLKMGGSVLIPAFALDRTQNVLYVIGSLKRKGVISEEIPVYVDSATAKEITRIYRKYKKYYGPEASKRRVSHNDPLTFPNLHEISSGDSLIMHERGEPAIYIASSAMLDHANAPKHLEKMIEDPKNLLAIVGWQAPDTPGWKLQRGVTRINIPIESYINGKIDVKFVEKSVKMTVKTFGMFSYHADGCQILKWLSNFSKIKEVFVVHGEKKNALDLADMITKKLGIRATAPELGEISCLSGDGQDYEIRKMPALCSGLEDSDAQLSGVLNSGQTMW